MKLISALLAHMLLLLTLRHGGGGLPAYGKARGLLALILALALVVCFMRWESVSAVLSFAFFIAVLALFGAQIILGYALISIGIDVLVMVSGLSDSVARWYEAIAFLSLVWRCSEKLSRDVNLKDEDR